jgi:PilZ domain
MRMCNGSGMLTRELGVRVINVSGSGCLIETSRRMEVGSVGRLQIRFGDEEYNDDIQVTRCDAVKGARSAYRVGVKFLWTTPRHPRSIRHAVMQRVAEPAASATTPRLM